MPQAENVGRVTVYMSYDAIDQMSVFAKEQGYKSNAEYARALIEKDMAAQGKPIDFGLETWGRHSPDTSPGDGTAKPKRASKKKTE